MTVVFGLFAVHVESALAGAGWQASNSQSVAARAIIQKDFSGLGATGLQVVIVDHHGPIASDPQAQAVVAKATNVLRSDPRVSTVVPPQAGVSISHDGRTAIITAGSAADSNKMVQAADAVEPKLAALSSSGITVTLTGDSALWADFNTANRSAMLRSEMLSWPVTIIILVIAFGSLVAAGLPLLLTMAGLLVAAGALVITTKFTPVSIWALNFALMFALALGIDYALFLVMRFRSALKRREAEPGDRQAIVASLAETMDTAGKAVAFSALTVLASLAAILIVPSPAFRSMAFGIMLAVVAVLAATLTLLPAVLGKLGTNINKGKVRLRRGPRPEGEGPLDRILHSWGKFIWRHPLPVGAVALVFLLLAAAPVIGMRTNMPSITIVPPSANARIGYDQVTNAFGPGAPGTLQVVVPEAEQVQALATLSHASGVAGVVPGPTNAGWTLDQVVPSTGPSTTTTGATIDHLRQALPAGTLIGGAAAENHDLQQTLASHTPLVLGILGVLGFLLLLIALGAPLIAATGRLDHRSVGGRGLRHWTAHLPERVPLRSAWFPATGLHRRLGTALLRGHGLRRGHGLHALHAVGGQGALRDPPRPRTRNDRLDAHFGAGRALSRRRHGCRVPDLRPVRAAGAQGDGGDPGHRRGPRRSGRSTGRAAGRAAPGEHHSWHQPKWLGRVLPKVRFSH